MINKYLYFYLPLPLFTFIYLYLPLPLFTFIYLYLPLTLFIFIFLHLPLVAFPDVLLYLKVYKFSSVLKRQCSKIVVNEMTPFLNNFVEETKLKRPVYTQVTVPAKKTLKKPSAKIVNTVIIQFTSLTEYSSDCPTLKNVTKKGHFVSFCHSFGS